MARRRLNDESLDNSLLDLLEFVSDEPGVISNLELPPITDRVGEKRFPGRDKDFILHRRLSFF